MVLGAQDRRGSRAYGVGALLHSWAVSKHADRAPKVPQKAILRVFGAPRSFQAPEP